MGPAARRWRDLGLWTLGRRFVGGLQFSVKTIPLRLRGRGANVEGLKELFDCFEAPLGLVVLDVDNVERRPILGRMGSEIAKVSSSETI
jgi:hypothetical protein